MKIGTGELFDRIRRDDLHGWHTVEDLLHHMPSWVQPADADGDIPSALWSVVPIDVLNRMNVPVAYGGLPLTATALRRAVVFERVGSICPALPMGMPGPGLSTPPVFSLGTEEQKKEYFARFCGQTTPVWGAFAITEPQGGSDATAMNTVATKSGNDYVLNGSKCFITSGRRADVVVVFASIDPSKGRFGIRAFVVDKGQVGFNVDRCEDMMGLRASQLAALSFTACVVPAQRMLGHNGRRGPLIDAFAGAQGAWDYMRPALAAGINGSCAAMIERAERVMATGDALLTAAETEAAREELRLFRARVHSAQLLALRAAWKFDSGQSASVDASMAKAFSSTLAMELAHRLARLFPLQAVQRGSPFEKFYRDAKAFDILEGTGDMQRLMIARAFHASTH
jgi:acyl-CoA dehydrogenase